MKRFFILLVIVLISTSFRPMADVNNVVDGQIITLDGTDQIIRFKVNNALKAVLRKFDYVPVFIYPLGAAGCKVGNEAITGSAGSIPQNVWATVAVIPGEVELHVQGTNTQQILVTY